MPQLSVAVALLSQVLILAAALWQSTTKGAGALSVGGVASLTTKVITARPLSQPAADT